MAAVARETQEENPRSGQSRNTSDPRINEDYANQVSEEILSRVSTKNVPGIQEDGALILCALFELDEFLLNLQVRT